MPDTRVLRGTDTILSESTEMGLIHVGTARNKIPLGKLSKFQQKKTNTGLVLSTGDGPE